MDESSKKNPPRILPRAISLLVTIKQNLMADNDLSFKVAECGKYAAAKYIDDLIANALELERRFHEIEEQYLYTKRENAEYAELLCGYSADILTDDEKEEVHALVRKWKEADSDWGPEACPKTAAGGKGQ